MFHRNNRVLPFVLSTGETLPTLVRNSDWIPARVATRWAVRRRRFECMPNTLAHNLRALALLYEWAETTIRCDLDEMLERSELPTTRQLDSLVLFLRSGGASPLAVNRLATASAQASAIPIVSVVGH
jgi:hypothetical protein